MTDLTIETAYLCESNREWEWDHERGYVVRFGPAPYSRGCEYDYSCTCKHFQMRLANKERSYCKHILEVRSHHCGWNSQIDPGNIEDGKCPKCGGPTFTMQVGV